MKDLVNSRVLSIVLLVLSIAILVLVIVPEDEFGDPLVRNSESPQTQLLQVTTLTLGSYDDMVQLLGASFAVVSFLIGYQGSHRLALTSGAWLRLSFGVLLLGVAQLLALLGREQILTMVARDAVNLGTGTLLYLRWSCYTCFTLAAVFVSSFAVSAANAPRSAEPSSGKQEEDA